MAQTKSHQPLDSTDDRHNTTKHSIDGDSTDDGQKSSLNPYVMSGHRSHFRNVRFFDETNPDVVLGGLIQNGSLTEKGSLTMLQMIVLITTAPIRVSAKDTRRVVSMVDTRLDVGDYMVSCEGRLGTVIVRAFPN